MANVSVGSTTGLYGIGGNTQILNNAQTLYNLLANSNSVGFYLTNSNQDVVATVLASGVTPNTYGDGTDIPIVTVGADGRITNITTVSIPTQTGTYSNTNVAAYLTGTVTVGNLITTAGVYWANGQPYSTGGGSSSIYGNANVAAYLPTYTGSLNNSSTITGINSNIAAFETYANVTYATQANLTAFETYANVTYATQANLTAFETYANTTFSTGGSSSYGNSNVAAYLPIYSGSLNNSSSIISINGNVTAANAAIATLQANVGSFYTYANATYQTSASAYSNVNTAAYLAGSISVGNIKSTNGFFWANGTAYSTGGGTTSTYSNANAQSYLSTTSVLNIGNAAPGGGQVIIGNQTTDNTVELVSAGQALIVGAVGGNVSLSSTNGLQIAQTDLTFSSASGQGGNINMNSTSGKGYINSAAGVTGQTFTSTNGYFWANGTAYSTQPTYGNTQVNAYLQSNTITQILGGNTLTIEPQSGILDLIGTPVQLVGTGSGNAAVITGGNIVLCGVNGSTSGSVPANVWIIGTTTQTGNITTSAGMYSTNGYFWANGTAYSTGSGSSTPAFSGNLAGNVLYDGTRGYVLANAYPFSTPDYSVGSSYYELYFQNPTPTYTNGVLQPPTPASANGVFVNSAHNANVGITHSSSQQTIIGNNNYIQVWPQSNGSFANNSNDRVRALTGVVETNLQGVTWGTMSNSSVTNALLVGVNGVASVVGTGQLSSAVGQFAAVQVVPKLGSANVQYATALLGQVSLTANAVNSYSASTITYARLVGGYISPTGNLTVTNAVGLHTHSGWAGSGSVVTNQRYAVLNEDTNTIIQSAGNIVLASGGTAGIVFHDGTFQSTAATSGSTYANANVASYLPTSTVNFGGNISTVSGNASIIAQSNVVDMSVNTGALYLPIGSNVARPSANVAGAIRFNSDLRNPEWYSAYDNTWKLFSQTYTPITSYSASYLIVAGGGAGGGGDINGGGGGGGGVLTGNTTVTVGTTYTVTVGSGGSPGSNYTTGYSTNGTNSVLSGSGIGTVTALGGGAGGVALYGSGTQEAQSGGSGGGARSSNPTAYGSGTAGQGYAGGQGQSATNPTGGGGGGGAGGVGGNAVSGGGNGGAGGVGVANPIAGSTAGQNVGGTYYVGGGGGGIGSQGAGITNNGGVGGNGGGGTGMSARSPAGNTIAGSAGSANTGGGGGGNGYDPYASGEGDSANSGGYAGGSGVVVLSVPTANYTGTTTGSPTITTSGFNTIITFTASGSYTA